MIYLMSFFVFLVVVAILGIFYRRKKRLKNLKMLDESWGQEIRKHRNPHQIQKYVDQVNRNNSLTEQTLIDVDIERLFSFVDRTYTTIGQQYLFACILSPVTDLGVLQKRDRLADHFINNPSQRNEVQGILYDLEEKHTDKIADIFLSKQQYHTSIFFIILSAFALISISTFWLWRPIAVIMLVLFGINLMCHLIMRYRNSDKLKLIKQVYQLTKVFDKLASLNLPLDAELSKKARSRFFLFRKFYHALDFGIPSDDLSTLIFYLFDLFKSFFLFELHLLKFCYTEILINKEALKALFNYIGETEMSLSIASLKEDKSVLTCTPVFSDTRAFYFENATHPLIPNCVPNSLSLNNINAFITGSNMSGKSTFLRTVLLNTILAQSFYLCFAKNFVLPSVRIFSSIKISDKLEDGSSYYFAEMRLMNEMMQNSDAESKSLFIIDEIFKGTNTAERIALSKAVLNFLGKNNDIVLASSHDFELIDSLGTEFEQYHFSELIMDDNLTFEHLIRPGGKRSMNAITIAEIHGFPSGVVELAKRLVLNHSPKNKAV